MRVKLLLLWMWMLAAALPAIAQTSVPDDVILLNNWRVHAGDDMNWAAAGFDDSAWQPSADPKLSISVEGQIGYTWYQSTVERMAVAAAGSAAI